MPQINGNLHDGFLGKRALGTVGYIGSSIGLDQFYWSLIQLVQFNYEVLCPEGFYVHVDRSLASGQMNARNELVGNMQGDWLLQIDSDHEFDPDTLMRMLQYFEGQKLDVLVGCYVFKHEPFNPVLFKHVGGEYKAMIEWGTEEMPRSSIRLLPIDAAGAGALLVRRSVFDRIHKEFGQMPFSKFPPYFTDDFAFFERCRRLGIKSWAAPLIDFGHLRVQSVGLRDYDSTGLPTPITVHEQALG